MIYPRFAVAISTTIALASCSPSGNPHLDMCQKITSNLLSSNVEFGEIQESKGRWEMLMTLPYVSDGESGEAVCTFAVDKNQKDRYQTSPKTMTLNGAEIAGKDLFKAAMSASKSVVADTAEETKKQAAEATEEAKVMASEAKDKATELAGEAKVKAAELTEEAKVKADEVATKIKDSEAVDRAKQLADEAKDKATATIIEGAKTVQEKLEN